MSNNPFVDHSANSAYSRFPDINASGGAGGGPSYQQQQQYQPDPGYGGYGGYGGQPGFQQPQPTGYGGFGGQPAQGGYGAPMSPGGGMGMGMQPMNPGGMGMGMGMQPMPTGAPHAGFHPTSAFGQHMAAQLGGGGGGGYGAPSPAPYQQAAPGGYQQPGWPGQQQQQQRQDWSAVAQFDPYSQLGTLDAPAPTPAPAHAGAGAGLFGGPAGAAPGSAGSAPASGQLHPRELVQRHKTELEAWDPYAWKQFTNAFDALKSAWEGRAREAGERVRQLGGMAAYDYGAAQESGRLTSVRAPLLVDACTSR
jgi:hypothetical protein